jgi:hypothetical protein
MIERTSVLSWHPRPQELMNLFRSCWRAEGADLIVNSEARVAHIVTGQFERISRFPPNFSDRLVDSWRSGLP